jgi:hypothetical protein
LAKAKGDDMNQALTLRDQNDMLKEELRQAQDALIGDDPWLHLSMRLRIPRKQELLLRALYKHPFVTREMMRVALDIPGTGRTKDNSYYRDHAIMHLVRRMMPPGSILCLSGRGHYLSPAGREWLRAALKDNTP